MSPVRTATRSARGRASSVFSSSMVLPDPGELIRFRQSTPFCRKRSRNSAAMRSFSPRTFFSSTTRFMLLQLQIGELDLVSADAFVVRALASGAAEIKIFDIELSSTVQATVTTRTNFDLEPHAFEFCPGGESLEGKLQCVRIDRRQLPDAQGNLRRSCF